MDAPSSLVEVVLRLSIVLRRTTRFSFRQSAQIDFFNDVIASYALGDDTTLAN